ncbi:MAG: aminotransferase class IV [Planctomycetota bacterium]|jgi:branched-chain amino acid aminotransferase
MSKDYSAGCAWIEGEYVPMSHARIPITDAGFSRSDCTYDVVAVWEGAFFRLDDHLARFERGYEKIFIEPPLSLAEMRQVLFECVGRSGLRDAYVEMIATRGLDINSTRDAREYDNRFYAFAMPYVWLVKPEEQLLGSHLVISERTIRIPENSVDPTVKNFHWGDLVRGCFEAYERGGKLAVLPDAEGNITEGPGFNIFAVKNGELFTPERGVLMGITRRTILALATDLGVESHVQAFDADFLRASDEVFATSTAGGVMPVTTVDGRQLGDGRPGPMTMDLHARYWQAHKDPRWASPVEYADAL